MITVQILCVGKLKEKFYTDAAAEYVKRLSGYCRLAVTELPEERLPQNPSQAQIAAALEKEGYLRREPNETDKRTWRVYPTERARQVYPQILRLCEQWQQTLLEALPEQERTRFEQTLRQVALRAVELCRAEEEE